MEGWVDVGSDFFFKTEIVGFVCGLSPCPLRCPRSLPVCVCVCVRGGAVVSVPPTSVWVVFGVGPWGRLGLEETTCGLVLSLSGWGGAPSQLLHVPLLFAGLVRDADVTPRVSPHSSVEDSVLPWAPGALVNGCPSWPQQP